jgi:teichuronic acid biosynthesis glycosyltransferase TuaG
MITIITPTYNSGKFIAETIMSIISQTYKNWELIVVDNFSVDNTENIVKSFYDYRIKYVKNEVNKGVAFSRNKGVEIAKGDYIAFIDADDIWEKDKLERQLFGEDTPPYDLVFTARSFIDKNSNPLNYSTQVPEKVDYKTLLKKNVISTSSVLVKRDLLLKYPFPEGYLSEDYAVWLKILQEIPYAYGINQPLLLYRKTYNSISSNKLKMFERTRNAYINVGKKKITANFLTLRYAFGDLGKFLKTNCL